jgi:acetyl-CoA carboxylase biotin carboxyl carrier protein
MSIQDNTEQGELVDLRTIRRLVQLMARYDLTAIDLGDGASRIRLRRRGGDAASPGPMATLPVAPATMPAAARPATSEPLSIAGPGEPGVAIESPMVGTFYSASTPESPPFVEVGSPVRADTIVCVIEAMKVFTDIPAGVGGTITEVLVKNGQAVEYGQPLFRVKPD